MPAKLRFLIPLAVLGLVGATIAVLVTGDDEPDPTGQEAGASSTADSSNADADSNTDEDGSSPEAPDDADADDSDGQDGSDDTDTAAETVAADTPPFDLEAIAAGQGREFPPPPTVPTGQWSDETVSTLDAIVTALAGGVSPVADISRIGDTGDARLGWAIADLLRFIQSGEANEALVGSAQRLLPGLQIEPFDTWGPTTDLLIAWDLPVPQQQYLDFKRNLFGTVEPRWGEMFVDGTEIDWRHVSWGGVGIDDREFGSTDLCRCIPALDNPAVTSADGGGWYPDDALVFGVEINGETRAYPKNIMEVHEMVNDTLGGRDIAMPYCTLCGSAQVYFTDELTGELAERYGRPVFRTSGLLIRSNKMMFEQKSRSFIDTFQGDAASGPLADAGVVFNQASVVTTTWADWRAAHPDTTIIAEDGGLGRSYDLDPLGGRDDNGPIFPIGDVDPRLPVQEAILGVLDSDGQPLAFHVEAAASLLTEGRAVTVDGIELRLDGSGVRAFRDGVDASGHQAFWFAWSQFYPDTRVWPLDF